MSTPQLHLDVATLQRPVLLLEVSTPQRHEMHPYGSTLQRPVLHLDVSTPQGPQMHLDLAGLQEPVLLLDVSTLQECELYLDEFKTPGTFAAPGLVCTTEACAASRWNYTTVA